MYRVELDGQKSIFHLEKHGMDFVSAQDLWNDPDLVQVKAKSNTEPRYLGIARMGGNHWSAVIIRIVSVRRSRKSEVQLHES